MDNECSDIGDKFQTCSGKNSATQNKLQTEEKQTQYNNETINKQQFEFVNIQNEQCQTQKSAGISTQQHSQNLNSLAMQNTTRDGMEYCEQQYQNISESSNYSEANLGTLQQSVKIESFQIFNCEQKEQIKDIFRTFSTDRLKQLHQICQEQTTSSSSIDPAQLLLITVSSQQLLDLINNEWDKIQNCKDTLDVNKISEDSFDELIHAEFFCDEECLLLPPVIFDDNTDKSEVNSTRNEWDEIKRFLNIIPKNTAHLEIYFEDKLLEKRSYNWCRDFLSYGFGFKPRCFKFDSDYQGSQTFDFENRLKSLWTRKNTLEKIKLRFVEGEIQRGANQQSTPSKEVCQQIQNHQQKQEEFGSKQQQISHSEILSIQQHHSCTKIAQSSDSNVRSRFQYFLEPNQNQKQQNQQEWKDDMELIDFPKENETIVKLHSTHLQILKSLQSLNNMITNNLRNVLESSNSENDWWTIDENTIQFFQTCKQQNDDKLISRCEQLILVRQCAELLVEYGIKVSELFFSRESKRDEFVEGWVVNINMMLEKALERVNRNEICDHPKLDALRQLLICSYTLKPENKMLLVARKASFFTLYSIFHTSNISVEQIDRGRISMDNMEERVSDAVKNATCLLTSFNSINLPNFPFTKFGLIILYQSNHQTVNLLRQSGVPFHVMKVQRECYSQDDEIPASNIDSNTNPGGGGTAMNSENSTNNGPKRDCSFCIIVSQHPESMIKSRRNLYETVVSLERQTAVTIFERPLHRVDMTLSCTCALTVWTQQLLTPQNVDTTLHQHIFHVIVRQIAVSSLAYSKLILLIEGSDQFVNIFLDFTPKFSLIAQRAQAHLQVYPSSQETETAQLLQHFIQAEQQNRTLLNEPEFQLADDQNPVEQFLSSFPSMNPLSAAVLSQKYSSVFLLLENLVENTDNIVASCPFIPKHSIQLLAAQISTKPCDQIDDAVSNLLQEFDTQQCIDNMHQQQPLLQQQQQQYQQHEQQNYQYLENQQFQYNKDMQQIYPQHYIQQQQQQQEHQQFQDVQQQDVRQKSQYQQYLQQQHQYQYCSEQQQNIRKQYHWNNYEINHVKEIDGNVNFQLYSPGFRQNRVEVVENQELLNNPYLGYQNAKRVDQNIHPAFDQSARLRNMQSEYAPNIQYTSMANNYERKKVGFPGSQPDVGTRQQLSIIREAENEGEQDFEYNYADNNQSKYNRNHMFKFSEHDSQNQNNRDGYLQNQYSPSTLQQNYQIQQIYNNIFYQQNQNNQMQYQIQTDPQQHFMSTRSYDSDFEFKNQRVLGNDLMGGQIERFLTPSKLNFQMRGSAQQNMGFQIQQQPPYIKDIFQNSPAKYKSNIHHKNTNYLNQVQNQYTNQDESYSNNLIQRQTFECQNTNKNRRYENHALNVCSQNNQQHNFHTQQIQLNKSTAFNRNISNCQNYEFYNQQHYNQNLQNDSYLQSINFSEIQKQGQCQQPPSQLRQIQDKLKMQITSRVQKRYYER